MTRIVERLDNLQMMEKLYRQIFQLLVWGEYDSLVVGDPKLSISKHSTVYSRAEISQITQPATG